MRTEGAWTKFLCEAMNLIVCVETKPAPTPSPNFVVTTPIPKYPMRLIDFDDDVIVCEGEDGGARQLFRCSAIATITCVLDVKKIAVTGPTFKKLMSAYAMDKRIDFIKILRDATRMGLKDAKEIAEGVWKYGVEHRFKDGG